MNHKLYSRGNIEKCYTFIKDEKSFKDRRPIGDTPMSDKDIRWIQRFNNYKKALSQIKDAVLLSQGRPLSKLEGQGLIQAFEFTHELAWKTLKDFLEHRGGQNLYGTKDTTRSAFQNGLIENGDVWMDMILSRNLTSHTYDEPTADKIIDAIKKSYLKEFNALNKKLDDLKREEQG
jgi:nucleotidyltransferase substrate binding protein (TIGR01987 family)